MFSVCDTFPSIDSPGKHSGKSLIPKSSKEICAFNKLINFYTTSCVSNCMTLSGN